MSVICSCSTTLLHAMCFVFFSINFFSFVDYLFNFNSLGEFPKQTLRWTESGCPYNQYILGVWDWLKLAMILHGKRSPLKHQLRSRFNLTSLVADPTCLLLFSTVRPLACHFACLASAKVCWCGCCRWPKYSKTGLIHRIRKQLQPRRRWQQRTHAQKIMSSNKPDGNYLEPN